LKKPLREELVPVTNKVVLSLDPMEKKILLKKLMIYDAEQTKETVRLDKYIKLLKKSQKELKKLQNDSNSFNMMNVSSEDRQKCKLLF